MPEKTAQKEPGKKPTPYKKALQLLTLAAQQKDYEQRKVG